MNKPQVRAIFIAPEKRKKMVEVHEAEALAGRGLSGDRYANAIGSYNKGKVGERQVTLMDVAHLCNTSFKLEDARRNIFTMNVELNGFITREFRIGRALFYGERYCEPCGVPGESFKEIFRDRGGIIAQVLRSGRFSTHDEFRDNFWTLYDRLALFHATTLDQALDVALKILDRMKRTGKKIIQICGPMTTGGLGDYEANMKLFRRVMDNAHLDPRFLVFDQDAFSDVFDRINKARPDHGNGEYWHELITKFYGELFRRGYFGGTYWIRNWEGSHGCQGEYKLCTECSVPREDCPAEWYA